MQWQNNFEFLRIGDEEISGFLFVLGLFAIGTESDNKKNIPKKFLSFVFIKTTAGSRKLNKNIKFYEKHKSVFKKPMSSNTIPLPAFFKVAHQIATEWN